MNHFRDDPPQAAVEEIRPEKRTLIPILSNEGKKNAQNIHL